MLIRYMWVIHWHIHIYTHNVIVCYSALQLLSKAHYESSHVVELTTISQRRKRWIVDLTFGDFGDFGLPQAIERNRFLTLHHILWFTQQRQNLVKGCNNKGTPLHRYEHYRLVVFLRTSCCLSWSTTFEFHAQLGPTFLMSRFHYVSMDASYFSRAIDTARLISLTHLPSVPKVNRSSIRTFLTCSCNNQTVQLYGYFSKPVPHIP